MRRPRAKLPPPHGCCPNAARHLQCRSFTGRPRWAIKLSRLGLVDLPILFCPWCGALLPAERPAARALRLVSGATEKPS